MTFLKKIAKTFSSGKKKEPFQGPYRMHWQVSCRSCHGFLLNYYHPGKKRYMITEVTDHEFQMDEYYEKDECARAGYFKCFPFNIPSMPAGGFWLTVSINDREIIHEYYQFKNDIWLCIDLVAAIQSALEPSSSIREFA